MPGEVWREATLYDEEGELVLARLRYKLEKCVAIDGFPVVKGAFRLGEELCPVHTGLAQLRAPGEASRLVRILRLSRPQGDGVFDVVEPLSS